MTQVDILKLLEREKFLLGSEIMEKLAKVDKSAKNNTSMRLMQLRKYDEINFVAVTPANVCKLKKIFPYLDNLVENGFKVKRISYLYFHDKQKKGRCL